MDSIPLWLNYLLDYLSSYNRKGKCMKESNDNAQFFNLVHNYSFYLINEDPRLLLSQILYPSRHFSIQWKISVDPPRTLLRT